MEKKFKVGDRVVMTRDYYGAKVDMIGVVKNIPESGSLAVEFIEKFNCGHTCHGFCKDGHGHYVHSDQVNLLSCSTKYKPGDIVTVRSDLRIGYYKMESGGDAMHTTEQMLTKRGQKVKIKSVTKSGKYMIEGSIFPWTDEMFVDESKVEPKKTNTTNTTTKMEPKKTDPLVTEKFSWDEFEKDKIIVRCSTKEDFNDFLSQCEARGYRWMSGNKPTDQISYYRNDGVGVYYAPGKQLSKSHNEYCEIYAKKVNAKIFNWKKDAISTKTWTLTLRGEGDRTFAEYVNNDLRVTGMVSRFFEDQYSVHKAIEAVVNKVVPEEKWIVSVKFDGGTRTYDYLTTDNTIKPGDKVVVATGSDNHHVAVTVTKIIPEKGYTFKGFELKGIVRKCEKGDEPVYYNGKVVCTYCGEGFAYTVGRIYNVVDGQILIDNGNRVPTINAVTFNDFAEKLHTIANFVEIVE